MKISLIIAVYKRADFLHLLLTTLQEQTLKGEVEIIVAEDGESREIKQVVTRFQNKYSGGYPYQVSHVAHEDKGWRKNVILNRAVRLSRGKLLVFIDGDCLLHPRFLEMYAKYMHIGVLLAGRRVELDEKTTGELLFQESVSSLSFYKIWKNGSEHVEQGFFLPFLSRSVRTLLGSNMGIMKRDLERINGFDEQYKRPCVGEDDDIEWRAKAAGIRMKSMKFKAIQYHLFHKKSYDPFDNEDYRINKSIMEEEQAKQQWFCEAGLIPKSARRLHIAFIRKSFRHHGGAERHASDFLKELAKSGHEVHLFANSWEPLEGVQFHQVKMFKFGAFLKTASFAYFVHQELKKHSFDIIQSNEKTLDQTIYRAGDGCHKEWLQRRMAYLPFWRRLFIYINPFHLLTLRIEKKILEPQSTMQVIAISELGKQEIIRHYGTDEQRIHVIYNGVDLELFHPPCIPGEKEEIRRKYGIQTDAVVVLFVGSGFERKGVPALLQAAAILKRRYHSGASQKTSSFPFQFVIAGKGKLKHYKKKAEALGLEVDKDILFTGIVKERELLFRASDMFCFPTIYEPFGNVHLEALASGVPVITTSASGAAEILTEGVNGYVVQNPADSKEIADKIEKCLNDEQRYNMSREARILAARFTHKANAEAILSLYLRGA